MRKFITWIWMRRNEGLIAKCLLFPLFLISLAVGIAARIRRARLAPKAHRAPVPVISVGNLAVGGTGKTPVTIDLAERLAIRRGKKVAILSRGYGRTGRDGKIEPLVVSDGRAIRATVQEGGDEPMLMAEALPGVPILVGPDRAALSELAVSRFAPDVLLLDDGFQHLKLARDLDVVLFDGVNPFGNGHVMPRGPLREPQSALRAAGLTWITRVDQAFPAEVEKLAMRLEKLTGKEPVFSAMAVSAIRDLFGRDLGTDALSDRRVFLACGLGHPEVFRTTADSTGCRVVGERRFDDHHAFTAADIEEIRAQAGRAGAEFIAITAKDAAKIAPLLGIGGKVVPEEAPQAPAAAAAPAAPAETVPEPAATAQTPPAEVPTESAHAPQEAAAAETPAENENIPSESAAPESAAPESESTEAPPSAESPAPAAADAAEAPSPAAESTAASEAESVTGAEEGKDQADDESDSESHGILPKFAVIHIRLKILSGDKAIEAALDRVLPP